MENHHKFQSAFDKIGVVMKKYRTQTEEKILAIANGPNRPSDNDLFHLCTALVPYYEYEPYKYKRFTVDSKPTIIEGNHPHLFDFLHKIFTKNELVYEFNDYGFPQFVRLLEDHEKV